MRDAKFRVEGKLLRFEWLKIQPIGARCSAINERIAAREPCEIAHMPLRLKRLHSPQPRHFRDQDRVVRPLALTFHRLLPPRCRPSPATMRRATAASEIFQTRR